jgi:hypothetical protein
LPGYLGDGIANLLAHIENGFGGEAGDQLLADSDSLFVGEA